MARRSADGWDEYGAPTVAKHPSGGFFAHYQGPNGERIVAASSKREACRKARKAWIRALLDPCPMPIHWTHPRTAPTPKRSRTELLSPRKRVAESP